jgi:predicted transcriptional regulator of viral defense system
MKYFDIKNQLAPLLVFSLQDLYLVDPEFRQPTLYDWEKAQKVIKLKNNAYIFPDFEPHELDFYAISNRLYQPSYVSTESALEYYGVIPEAVVSTTAISSNKTQAFSTPVGNFTYQSIRSECFFGYNVIQHKKHGITLAYLEKAILDYLYLHSEIQETTDIESLRWNKEVLNEQLDNHRLQSFAKAFGSQILLQRLEILQKYLKK